MQESNGTKIDTDNRTGDARRKPEVPERLGWAKRMTVLMAGVALAACAPHTAAKSPSPDTPPTPSSSASADPSPTASPEKPHRKLTFLEKLPGYNNKVTERERAMLRASTVKIVERPKGDLSFDWLGVCSGTKVSIGGKTYISTARHCLDSSIDVLGTFPSLQHKKDGPDLHSVVSITDDLGVDFGVRTITDGHEDTTHAAVANDVRVIYYPDIGLVTVDQASPEASAFKTIPAIAFETFTKLPAAGSEAVLYSLPEVNNGEAVESGGRYLGRVTIVNDDKSPQTLDLVGIKPSTSAEDACKIGSSGSMAIIAGGYTTGPLNIRNDPFGSDNASEHAQARATMAAQLGYSIDDLNSAFPVICGYSVPTSADIANLTR